MSQIQTTDINKAIDEALKNLRQAKKEIDDYNSAQEEQHRQKVDLESVVSALRDEKTQLELDIQTMKHDLSNLRTQLSGQHVEQQEQHQHDDEEDFLMFDDSQATELPEDQQPGEAFAATEMVEDSQATELPEDDRLQTQDFSGVENFDNDDGANALLDRNEQRDEEMSVSTTTTVSTTASSPSRKRRAHKKVSFNSSPKKWRRMVRDHRLKSIYWE